MLDRQLEIEGHRDQGGLEPAKGSSFTLNEFSLEFT